jgi:O-antigen ligase
LLVVQLIPLPPAIWMMLPGRGFQVDGLNALGIPPPWAALSLAPSDTFGALFSLLVPAAFLVVMARYGASPAPMIAALLIGTLAGAILGLAQVGSGGQRFYLYRFSDWGTASGFFANTNHMATLLLVCVPFIAALAHDVWQRRRDSASRLLVGALAGGCAVLMAVAIYFNGSMAILALAVPVLAASAALLFWDRSSALRRLALPTMLGLLVVATAATALAGLNSNAARDASIGTRQQIWSTTAAAIGEFRWAGSGVGSFPGVYRQHEDPAAVDRFFVNHAHNDYLEIALETGLPGVLLLLAFLVWWSRRAVGAWGRGSTSAYARAASIASAAVLAHSIVDFPLRTAALAAVFSMSIGFLVMKTAPKPVAQRDDLWPTRHLTAG